MSAGIETLKNRILLEHYYLPSDLERQVAAFVVHYNHARYHESLLLGPRGLQKITVRHQLGRPVAAVPDRLSRAIPFNPFKPLDRHQFADCVAPRRCAAAHLAPLHRVNHPITQVLRIRLRHSLLASAQPTG